MSANKPYRNYTLCSYTGLSCALNTLAMSNEYNKEIQAQKRFLSADIINVHVFSLLYYK